MKIVKDKTIKPKFPPCRILYEPATMGTCACESSFKFNMNPFVKKKCIQPNCDNYYKGFPSEDLDLNNAVTINGETIYQWRLE